MDCKTARLLIEFDRPHCPELESADRAALEGHLAGCADCEAQARGERQVDDVLGKAMRQVEVPDRLRNLLLARLERERGDWYRRWFAHGARLAAAAAAVVLLVWGAAVWWGAHRPVKVDAEMVWQNVKQERMAPLDREGVERYFRDIGHETAAPREMNYSFLSSYGLAPFQGKQVPCLYFISDELRVRAQVRILSDKHFDLEGLERHYQSPHGYEYKVEITRQPGAHYAYVYVYSGVLSKLQLNLDDTALLRGSMQPGTW
jgi:hypothetical protein